MELSRVATLEINMIRSGLLSLDRVMFFKARSAILSLPKPLTEELKAELRQALLAVKKDALEKIETISDPLEVTSETVYGATLYPYPKPEESADAEIIALYKERSDDVAEAITAAVDALAVGIAVQGVGIARDTVRAIYDGIRKSANEIVIELTKDARRQKAPHPHRPDLRGSGVPRKRGKGKY